MIWNGPIDLPSGVVYAYASRPIIGGAAIVFLHGTARSANHLYLWFERLQGAADLLFIDLPGHGNSDPITETTLPSIADQVRKAIEAVFPARRVLIVGESVGGLIALQIGATWPGAVAGILAADPPLAMRKLYNAQWIMKKLSKGSEFMQRLSEEVFGVYGDRIEDRFYYDLIGACHCPVSILTGDLELLPPRQIDGAPCCLDGTDRYIVETFFADRATFQRKADAGHLLLVDHPGWCHDQLSDLARVAGIALPLQGPKPG